MKRTINKKENLLSLAQVAERLNVSIMTVRNFINAKELKAYKIGRQYRLKENELQLFIDKKST